MASKGERVPLRQRREKEQSVELAVDKGITGDPDVVMLPAQRLRIDGGTQNRVALRDETLETYREIMADAEGWGPFPPVDAVYDGADYWLVDGFHRIHVVLALFPEAEVPVRVTAGTLKDAILRSLGANHDHGLPRSNADKRRAVIRMLTDEDYGWQLLSDREIARHCAVSPRMVGMVRGDLVEEGKASASAARVGSDGRAINTAKIGRPSAATGAPIFEPYPETEAVGVFDEPRATPEQLTERTGLFQGRAPLASPAAARKQEKISIELGRAVATKLYEAIVRQTLRNYLTPSETEELEKALRSALSER